MKKLLTTIVFLTLYQYASAQSDLHFNDALEDVLPFSEQIAFVKVKADHKWHAWRFGASTYQENGYNAVFPYRGGFAAVRKGKVWLFIDKAGVEQSGEYQSALPFSNGLAAVKQNQKWGFIDTRFEQVIPFNYLRVDTFANNRCKVVIRHRFTGDYKQLMIDPKEKVIATYDSLGSFSGARALVSNRAGTEVGYVNASNDLKVARRTVKYAGRFSENKVAISTKNGTLVYFDTLGVEKFSMPNGLSDEPSERYLHDFSDGLAAVKKELVYVKNKRKPKVGWIYITHQGEEVTGEDVLYDAVTPFSQGIAAVRQGDEWFFIDKTGTIIRKDNYSDAKPCTDGVAWAKKEGVWGMVWLLEKPIVTINSHEDLMEVSLHRITLKATVKSPTRLKTNIIVNDTILPNLSKLTSIAADSFIFEQDIELKEGKNRISIQCSNIGGNAICHPSDITIIYKRKPIKDALKECVDSYKEHIDRFLNGSTVNLDANFASLQALFQSTDNATIYNNIPNQDSVLSLDKYRTALAGFSGSDTLQLDRIGYCRDKKQKNIFYVHIEQWHLRKYKVKNPAQKTSKQEFKKLEHLFVTVCICQDEQGEFLIRDIQASPERYRMTNLLDKDGDGIPNDCDNCPNTKGSLDKDGCNTP